MDKDQVTKKILENLPIRGSCNHTLQAISTKHEVHIHNLKYKNELPSTLMPKHIEKQYWPNMDHCCNVSKLGLSKPKMG